MTLSLDFSLPVSGSAADIVILGTRLKESVTFIITTERRGLFHLNLAVSCVILLKRQVRSRKC